MKPLHLIVNPRAGRGRTRAAAEHARSHFESHGRTVHPHVTTSPEEAHRLVSSLPLDAVVVSVGGDGTLHGIARACIHTPRTVGIIPAGSGDDFAYAVGIKRHDITHALQVITGGRVRHADTATVNGRPFLNSLGIGFDADVAHAVAASPSVFRGQGAYIYGILTTLGKLASPAVRVHIDDMPFYEGPAVVVTTQNGPSTGGGFLFAPDASPFDGKLDVLIAGSFGRARLLRLLPKVVRGTHMGTPGVHLKHAERVHITWHAPRPGHMEGELLGAALEFDIRIVPQSLRVYAP